MQSGMQTGEGKGIICSKSSVYCEEDNYLASCENIKKMLVHRDVIKNDGRCFICSGCQEMAIMVRGSMTFIKCHPKKFMLIAYFDF